MLNSSNNSKFKNIDELKARMAAKNGGNAGGTEAQPEEEKIIVNLD